jgi:hypothetical protein
MVVDNGRLSLYISRLSFGNVHISVAPVKRHAGKTWRNRQARSDDMLHKCLKTKYFRPLAQSVEHLTFNQGVPGSSPGRPTFQEIPP